MLLLATEQNLLQGNIHLCRPAIKKVDPLAHFPVKYIFSTIAYFFGKSNGKFMLTAL